MLLNKIQLHLEITIQTGLHIGGSKMDLNIGGIDNPVIKDQNGVPYIPGSSLKGKMRSLLAKSGGKYSVSNDTDTVKQLFGVGANERKVSNKTLYSRLLFEDMYPILNQLRNSYEGEQFKDLEMDMPYTEVKHENVITRSNGAANPRQIERVPHGAIFKGKITIDFYEGDNWEEYLKMLHTGFSLLTNDYLGGSGSRGYGRVSFNFILLEQVYPTNNGELPEEIKKTLVKIGWKDL